MFEMEDININNSYMEENEIDLPVKKRRGTANSKGSQINIAEVCILRINEPCSLEGSEYYRKKKFSVRIYYVKKNDTNKIRQNTIMFGNKKLRYFSESGDMKIKLRR